MPAYRVIPTGDLALTGDRTDPLGNAGGGNVAFVEGLDQVRQRLATRFKFFLGEWFLDLRQGIPYYRDVLVADPNLPMIRALYRRVVLKTPGVLALRRFDLKYVPSERLLQLDFEAVCDGGIIEVLPGDDDFIVDLNQTPAVTSTP
jgi:hypothetical protein